MVRHRLSMAVLLAATALGAWGQRATRADLEAILDSRVAAWRWHFGEVAGAESPDFDDSHWETVRVGHKWWPSDSTCWYRTAIRVPERIHDLPVSGATVLLRLGVDNEAQAYVDGELKGRFEWDGEIVLREHAQPGDTVIVALHCINRPGYGSLYKAEPATNLSAPFVDALRGLLDDCDTAAGDAPFLEEEEAAHWACLSEQALEKLDLASYRAADHGAFLRSVEAARGVLLSDLGRLNDSLEATARMLEELKRRIEEGKKAGREMAYQTVDARVVESFIEYARDDAAAPDTRHKLRGLKIARYIHRLCRDALADETDWPVPRYRTGPVEIREGAFRQGDQIVFFTGVGHFDQVRKDVPILADYGLNIIQIEMGPSNALPGPEMVDAQAIEERVVRVLDNAARHDIAVNLLISPHYFPRWAIELHPELAECGYGFLKHCIDAPEGRAVHEKWLRALMPRIAGHPALHSICLSNEPQYQGRCRHSLGQFHRWLAQTHGKVETMNRRWGSRYRQFDEVPIPEDRSNYGLFLDWWWFNQERFLGFHEFLRDIIHEYVPDLPVHVKVMPLAFGDPGYFMRGIDHEAFTLVGTIAGNDGWQHYVGEEPGVYAQDWLTNAINYTLQHSVAPDSPIFNSEDHVIRDGEKRFIPAEQIRTAFWTQALWGQGAATTWVWERGEAGDLAENILTRPNCVRAMGRVALDLNRLAREVHALQRAPVEASILYSYSSLLPSSDHADEATAAFEGACFTGATWGFVTERQALAGRLDRYKLVVVPRASHVPDGVLEAFEGYLARGGTLVTVGECFTRDEYGRPRKSTLDRRGDGRLVVYPDPLTPASYRDIFEALLDKSGCSRPVRLTGAYGEPVWGIYLRAVEEDGDALVSLVNFLRDAKRIRLQAKSDLGTAVDVFTGRAVTFPLLVEPLSPVLVRIKLAGS